jgi:DNA repair exonuclease SbcCD ATPase subunit
LIYFIQQGLRGPIKIGLTSDISLHKRLGDLSTGNPYCLRKVGSMKGGMGEEKKLHRKFGMDRMQGEWFKASVALCNFANSQNLLNNMQKANPFDSKDEDVLMEGSDKVREAQDKHRIHWLHQEIHSKKYWISIENEKLKEELECIKIIRAKLLSGKEEKQIEQLTFDKYRAESQLDKTRKEYIKLQDKYDKLQEESETLQGRYDNIIVRVDMLEELLGIYRDRLEALDCKLHKGLKAKFRSLYNKYIPKQNRAG